MLILLVIALPIEAKYIKEQLNFKNNNIKIKTLITGVGSFNAIYNIKDYIDNKQKPDFIVNIGLCGQSDNTTNSQLFQVYKINNISNNKEALCPIYINFARLENILCSDKIATNQDIFLNSNFVDMESYGVDYICSKEKIPYIILKQPLDIVGRTSTNITKQNIINKLENICDFKILFENIYKYHIENAPILQQTDLDKISEKHGLSFTQKNQLKKAINKQIALNINYRDIIKNYLKKGFK